MTTSDPANGFSLFELVIVLAVIVILGGTFTPLLMSVIDWNRRQIVANELESIAAALEDYYFDNAAFPTSLVDVTFTDVYLQTGVNGGVVFDEWGPSHRYAYQVSNSPDLATIHSFGEDGVDQGASNEEFVVRVSSAVPGMKKTRTRMRIIVEALSRFLEAGGKKLPKGWKKVRRRLGLGKEYELDGFGNVFRFDEKKLSLTSDGPDGRKGTADDLTL